MFQIPNKMEQKSSLEKAIKKLHDQVLAKQDRDMAKQKQAYEWFVKDQVSPDGIIGEDFVFKKPAEWISWMHNETVSRIRDLEVNLVETIINLRAEINEAEEMAASRAGQERDIVVELLTTDVSEQFAQLLQRQDQFKSLHDGRITKESAINEAV